LHLVPPCRWSVRVAAAHREQLHAHEELVTLRRTRITRPLDLAAMSGVSGTFSSGQRVFGRSAATGPSYDLVRD
jgi:hypothetical protein